MCISIKMSHRILEFFFIQNNLQSVSRSLLSLVPRRSFSERRLNDPPAGACVCVPRRSKNGLTLASGRLC